MAKLTVVGFVVIILKYGHSTDSGIKEMGKNNYGRFRLSFDKIEPCNSKQQPKISDLNLDYNEALNKLTMNISILAPCRLQDNSKSRIIVERVVNSDTKQVIFRYNIKNPCTHFAVSSVLTSALSLNRKCVIEKGFYSLALDMQRTAEIFLGTRFFYEDLAFHSILRCSSGVLMCVEGVAAIRKQI